jgi:hypothetical protein
MQASSNMHEDFETIISSRTYFFFILHLSLGILGLPFHLQNGPAIYHGPYSLSMRFLRFLLVGEAGRQVARLIFFHDCTHYLVVG